MSSKKRQDMSVFRKRAGEKDMKENRIGMRIVKAGVEIVRT